jgi:hypothetical protein
MMQLTPSSKSAFLSGMALSLMAWLTFMEFDELAKLFRIRRFFSKRKMQVWINENKALAFLGTETLNFGIHGVTGTETTTFALGSCLCNAIAIFICIPVKFLLEGRRLKASRLHIIPSQPSKTTKTDVA